MLAIRRYLIPMAVETTRERGDDKLEMWQYKIVFLDEVPLRASELVDSEVILNSLGQQGWEFVTVSSDSRPVAYLKRKIQASA